MKYSFLIWIAAAVVIVFPLRAQTVYSVASGSSVVIAGTSTLSDWKVTSNEVSGQMAFASGAGKIAKGAGTVSEAKVSLDVASIKSEKGETMDNKMYSALKQEAHPRILFHLTKPLKIQKVPSSLPVTGEVTLAGVRREMTFTLDLTAEAGGLRFKGSHSLKLSDFDIEPPSAMFGQIETGNEITVHFDLHFSNGSNN